jgi:3-hydroxyisobutyrate dehydrogenase
MDTLDGSRVASPLLDICHSLYAEADALGERDLDMVAVIRAIEQHTAALAVEAA